MWYVIFAIMATFLFDEIIFGPVWSRRLGESLGINLLPAGKKVCNFNCIYCECGSAPFSNQQSGFPAVEEVCRILTQKLTELKGNSAYLNSITFAGNGEPTLHPQFAQIIDEVLQIRNRIFPEASVAVLSNATQIVIPEIFEALRKVDLNILKLDSAIEETLFNINCPRSSYDLKTILNSLKKFEGRLIIQSLFLKGFCNGIYIDNTTDREVTALVRAIESIKPEMVMLYSLARDTASDNLQKISGTELERLASILENKGIKTQVTP